MIDVAVILKEYDIKVEAMFLFDAVDRSLRLSGDVIPNNVEYCYHAFRHPASKSRESFGNTGTRSQHGVNFEKAYFMTTHGGLGGSPWNDDEGYTQDQQHIVNEGFPDGRTTITVQQENAGMAQVKEWMGFRMRLHSLQDAGISL